MGLTIPLVLLTRKIVSPEYATAPKTCMAKTVRLREFNVPKRMATSINAMRTLTGSKLALLTVPLALLTRKIVSPEYATALKTSMAKIVRLREFSVPKTMATSINAMRPLTGSKLSLALVLVRLWKEWHDSHGLSSLKLEIKEVFMMKQDGKTNHFLPLPVIKLFSKTF